MGNEASLEGVEGGLLGLPEGVASDGKGGYIRVPAGMEADLSQLSEDERKQIAAVMSRARAKPPENAGDAPSQRKSDADANHQPRLPGNPPAQGPSGISKSRTVDAFRTGPPARRAPGRSPSSVSLLESRSRQEAKQEPRVSMFSSNFLSGANPLSAVSSAVNKFSLFGDEEEDEAKKQQKPAQQQSGPGKVPQQQQGPPKQNQGPPQQRAAPQHGPGPQRQGPPGPQQRGPGAPPQQQGPVPNTGVPGQKSLCPLCKTTELNLQTKEQANYNTCTQCRSVVCSLCGFSPPDSAVKEWLCLNCQMQRALGGMDPPGPPAPKQAPPAATQPAKAEPTKPPEARKPPALTKQKTVTDTGKPATPPATPPAVQRGPDPAQEKPKPQGGPDPAPQQSKPAAPSALKELPGPDEGKSAVAETPPSQTKTPTPARDPAKAEQQPPQQRPLQEQGPPPGQQPPGGAPKADPKATGPPQQQPGKPQQQVPKEGPGPSPAKPVSPPQAPPPKQESGFFGLSFGGLTEATKPPSAGPQPPAESAAGKLFGFGGFTDSPKPPAAAESVTGKLFGFGGFSDTPKPPTASAPPPADSVSGKMFGFGGFSDTPKPPAASAPPPADSVSGKMFGFGGFSDTPKPPAASAPPPADSVSGKMFGFGGFSDTPKPPAASAPPPADSVSGKMFGFGGFSDTPKPPAASAPPPADSVSGKMFGFGSSIFSSASNLITSSVQEELPPQVSAQPKTTPPPQVSAQPKTTPPPQQGQGPPSPHEKKPIHGAERPKAAEPSAAPTKAQPNCPLCKVELNVGSQDPPNYNTCTECKKTVCDLCGFNPMPHMTENEWLCLNCQTQRALAGQLGDMGKMPPPMPAPVKPASQQTATPKSQPSPPKTTSVPTEPGPGKPSPDQQKTSPADTVSPSPSSSATIPPASAPELSPAPPEPEAVPPEPSPAPPEPEAVPPEPSPAPPEPEAVPPEPSPAPPEPEAAPPEPSPAPPEPTALAPENNVPPQESTPPVKVTAPEPTSPPPENAARPPEPTSPPPDKGVSPEPTHPSEIFEASEPTTPPPEKVIPKPSSPPPEKLVCHFEPATPPEKVGIPDSTIPPPEKVATSDPLDLTAPPSEHTIPPPEDDMAPESTTHPSEIVVASEPTAPPTDQFAGPEATSPPPEKAAPPSEHTTSADNVVAPETTSHPSEIVAASKHTTPAPEKIAGPECTSPPSEKAEPPSELTKPPAEMVVTPEPTAHPSEVIVASEPTTPPPQKVADPESTSTPLEKAEPPSELTTPPAEKVVTPEPTAHPSEVIVAYEPTTPPEKVADPESTSTPLEKAAPPSELNSPPPEKLLAPESTTHPAEIVVASKPTTPPTEKVAGPESTATPLEKDTPPSELTTPSQDKVGVSEPTSFPLEKVSAPEPPSLPPEKDAPPYEPTTSLPEKVVAPEINTSPPEEAAAPEPTTLLPDHTDVPPELALVPQQSTTSTSELNAAFLQSAASTPKSEYMEAVVQEIEEERHLVVQAREFVPEPIQTPHTATDNMQATPFTQGQGTEPSAPSTAVIEQTCAPTEALDKQSPVTQEKSTAEQLTETDAEAGELKEEIISDTIDSCQQKSPQGLSDTGHPSDGISSSLGEIPTVAPTREKEPLKEPVQTENVAEESSLTGPSDVKMSESLALSVSEGGPGSSEKEDPYTIDDQELNCQETKKLPISLEGSGSLKEEMGQTQERVESLTDASHGGDPMKFQKTKEASLRRNQSYDSDKDKDGSEPLTMPQMRVKTSEVPSSSNEHKQDHLGSGKDNELVQKKITGTSRNQVLAADEDNCMQQQIKEPELKCEENKSKGELKSTSGKSKRFLKKSVRHDDDDPVQQKSNEQRHDESPATNVDEAKSQEVQEHTTISRRTYPTLCAERALTDIQASEGKTQEMEKLPDSPEDRSRADGSSSLHASSFTSGTSPTSVSSLDEDSEESQSHKGLSGESKHRKAKDRQQAQGLPTTEDYSEEEGLHEEGELLYQEEMQLELGQRQPQKKKTFSQKLNRDKEELLAQLGLEHQKTPPGSLFPIKDASPTDEIPQAAAMEETNKSSYSDISQSIESEPEGFVSNTKKIHDVHKVHQVPMAVDAYSPTNEQHTEIITDTVGKPLKGADEAYEAIMQKQTRQVNETHQNETFVPPVISQTCYVTISSSDSAPLAKDDKPLLDAEAAYEKLMKRQGPILTLETTTTKSVPDLQESAEVVIIPARDDEKENAVARGSGEEPEALPLPFDSPIKRALRPIPDLKITQCSSGEEDFEEEESITPENEVAVSLISPEDKTASEFEQTSITIHAPIPTPTGTTTELEPMSVVCEVPQLMSTPTTYPVSVPTIDMVSDFPEMEQISVVCEIPQLIGSPAPTSTAPNLPPYPASASNSDPTPVSASVGVEQISVVCSEIPQPRATPAPSLDPSLAPSKASALAPEPVPVTTPAPPPVTVPESATVPGPVPPSATVTGSVNASEHILTPVAIPFPATELNTADIIQVLAAPPLSSIPMSITPLQTATETPYVVPSKTVVVVIQPSMEEPTLPQSSAADKPVAPTALLPEPVSTTSITEADSIPLFPSIIQSTQEHVVISVPGSDDISTVPCTSDVIASTMTPTATSPSPSSFSIPSPPAAVTVLPTVPQYISTVPKFETVVSDTVSATPLQASARPVSSEPATLFRGSSQEKVDAPIIAPPPPPPLPPYTLPKYAIDHKKTHPISTHSSVSEVPVSTAVSIARATVTTTSISQTFPTYKPHFPPPVPPKPSSILASSTFSPKLGGSVVPPVSPKPAGQSIETAPPRTPSVTLNLTAWGENKLSATSPISPLSPRHGNSLHDTYVVITLPSEPGTPVEATAIQAPPSKLGYTMPTGPVEFSQYTKSIESQQIRGPDKVVSSRSHTYSSISTAGQSITPPSLPNLFTQVVTTEVQRTTVSVVHERVPSSPPVPAPRTSSVAIAIPPEAAKVQPKPKENDKVPYSCDVVDLRTLRLGIAMTEKGMDLSSPDSRRQSFSSDSSGRQTSAVQSAVVNLSAESTPGSTLSIVSDSITIVTCTATIAYSNSVGNRGRDLSQAKSMPLPLTTSKSFEPVAQIIYRPIDSQPTTSSRNVDIPVNLSFGAIASAETSKPAVSEAQASLTNGTINHAARTEAGPVGAVDLTTTKPFQTMVSVDESTLEVITTVIEDDGKPVDLTARRQAVCCDVVYKLPFARSCAAPQPLTTLPEDRFGYRDDHYQYDRSGANCTRGFGGMKPSMSDTNLAEAGLFFYKSKNSYDYQNGATEGAIDLTSGKVSTGEILGYSSKVTGAYSRMTIPSYSQARITPVVGTHFGVNSVLRSSNGVVYSSVAAPVPSMYAITTQPGSIFSSAYKGMHSSDTMPSLSTLQQQPLPRSYSFFSTTTAEQEGAARQETGVSKEAVPMVTTLPDAYTDASLGAIAASLEALASPVLSGLDSNERRQYEMEREFLELEKIKQLRLAEELEWERQEIQRFREQEQLIVQKELEELQSMKHQLLFQQEEERQAHLMMQQETYAQQQLQLEQIQQLRDQLQQQLEEQKVRQMYPYGSEGSSPSVSSEQIAQDPQCTDGVNDLYWPDHAERITQYISDVPDVSEMSKGQENLENLEIRKMLTSRTLRAPGPSEEHRTITDSLVLNDVQDGQDRVDTGRRKRSKRSVDSSVQTDDEDQDEWDTQARSRRRSRSTRYLDGEQEKQDSQVSSIAIQTVAEISVQTDPSSKKPSVRAQLDTKVEITKSPSESEETYSLRHQAGRDAERTSPQRDKRRPIPLEIGYTAHLKADSNLQVAPSPPKSPKVLYSPLSPMSPDRSIEFGPYENPQKVLHAEPSKPPPTSPRTLKAMHRSMSDPKPSSPTADERAESNFQCTDGYSGSQSGSPSGTQKKVKRTLPNTPPEEGTATGPTGYSTASARRRLCRNTTAARAKILQDIDRELDLVERESSKLRKKQAELDEEEKEIDARLRCLETGISRRKEALLKEREERERAYLQGVAEERDYMSDSEVSNIRETRGNGHGLERPRTAPQSELNQLVLPQTQPKTQYAQPTSPYTQYQYSTATQASQQALYRPQSLYHQQVTPYQTQSIYSSVPTLSYAQASRQSSQHASQMLLKQQKSRQKTMSTLEPKITANYDVAHNRPLLIVPSPSADHLGGKYNNLDLRIGLDERSSMASSPMSAISADSYYTNIEQHAPRSYTLLEDELAKAHAGLPSGYGFPDKDPTKTDRLLRATDVRRAGEVTDFLGSLQAHARLHPYMKVEEDAMEEPYELKLLKQQLKQEFQRSTDGLDHLSGLPQYHHGDSNYRNFPKTDKYSISRLTLEKQAAKQLPVSVLYPKQAKHKKTLMDPKITKFSPIQESKDISATGYSSYLASSATSISGLASRARLLQDDLTFGLRKNISEQQRYLGSTLGANLAQSLNLGQALGSTLRSSLLDDTAYPSGSRSRPSSRPNSMYGLDLSIKRDLSSSSLRLKTETEDPVYRTPSARAKPTSLPISQSRGRIPIVAQNSEEESPLSPVGQPMGMARASAGPLPPIAADNRDQFGSSHSLPEVQQHMREESRIRSSDWAAAYAMDDLQSAMSDSEAGGGSWDSEAYHLRQEEADWLDKPREAQGERGRVPDQNQVTHKHQHGEKPVPNAIPHTTVKLQRDPKDRSVSGNGLGIRVVGGKEIPGSSGEIGAYVARVLPGGIAEQTGKVAEGMQVLEWNGIPLTGKSYEEVQGLVGRQCEEAEVCIRLDINMLSESGQPQHLGLSEQSKAGDTQRSPGVDPKQLATELQKVSQQQAPATASYPPERGLHVQSGAATASPAPSPGQPGSPSVAKKRHSSRPTKTQSHPITGEIQLQLNYDRQLGNLIIHILQARSLSPGDNGSYSDPFVKVYLLPGRGQVMVVQNASAENKRRDRHVQKSLNPEWNQTVIYKNIHLEQLKKKTLEVTVWDYDRFSSNDFLGEVLISLSNFAQLDNVPHWFPLKEQSEGVDHGRAQSSPKPPVIKSRSHSVLPDSSKDTQVPTIEKSHSNPDSSKPSSEVHLRPHTPSRNRNRGGVAQGQLDNGPQTRLQQTVHRGVSPSHSKKQHRHSVAGVLTIHRTQSDSLPVLANESKDTSQLTMRKAMSEETPKNAGARSGLLGADASISGLGGSAFNLECEDGSDAVDSAIFQVPQIGKNILHDTSRARGPDPPGLGDTEGKTQAMGEIKVALKKDMKIEGEQLVVEILQCRNITYKFKSSEHLPDLYVKLYVVNVATQKRVIKKKTRVCRHDREPSFNETFRFSINPAGHSIQLFLVSNGGKFVKKTLIGEAYIWLDKVDLRKRSVSWHQLLASSTQMHP